MSLLLLTVSELLNEGMLCTYTPSLSTGGVGNLVQVRNTLFWSNCGYTGGRNDYGAAVALSLLNRLERSNFRRHEITNW